MVNTCIPVLTLRDSDLSGVLMAVGRAASPEDRAVDKNILKKKMQQPDWLSRKLAEGLYFRCPLGECEKQKPKGCPHIPCFGSEE